MKRGTFRNIVRAGLQLLAVGLVLLLWQGCSPTKFLTEDELLLDKVAVKSESRALDKSSMGAYVRQHPNSKWFGLFKVPLGVYSISGTNSERRINRFFRKIGEAPVVYDSILVERTRTDMEQATRNLGYLHARVEAEAKQKGKRIGITYHIFPDKIYTVTDISRQIDDPSLEYLYENSASATLLYEGMPFDLNVLDRERTRFTSLAQNNGYYKFNKSNVSFDADTTLGNYRIALRLKVPLYRETSSDSLMRHQIFQIGKVNYLTDLDLQTVRRHTQDYDSMRVRQLYFYQRDNLPLSPVFLVNKTDLRSGSLYSENDVMNTYSNLSSLSALRAVNVAMEPSDSQPNTLDAYISLLTAKRHAISTDLEGTNSAGDFGAALSVGYQNRNMFRRSAQLGVTLRGAFEAIKGLEGYNDQNYIEYSAEVNLNFPEFRFPFLSHRFHRAVKAQSIASIMYDSQDRPEFHRRVLTAAWRYRWSRFNLTRQHRIDLLDLNYVFMPWISQTFKDEYLTDNGSRNAVLRYNYENLFIMKWGYTFQYTNLPPTAQSSVYGQNAYNIRIGVETAGNLLYGMSHLFHGQYSDSLGVYTLFNIAYAQYAKLDFDIAKSIRFDERNSLGLHFALGVAYPYGNSTVLPYEKRYFSGGANSVRGWGVRDLGPGKFLSSDGKVDFIRQTGDLKLDMNLEWRSHLFWKIDGAAFIDGGNIWTLRNYEEQPGGQFRLKDFWRQIAVAYGMGIRLNFGYFILRLDAGMKAINPDYDEVPLFLDEPDENGLFVLNPNYIETPPHFPLFHPRLSRDFHLHFAVGLPF